MGEARAEERADARPQPAAPARAEAPWRKKAFWLRHVRTWHWISGAITLVGMLLFSITGITLNHAGDIEARPSVETVESTLPAELLARLQAQPTDGETVGLPDDVAQWLRSEIGASTDGRRAEWSDIDVYIGMPRPGGDGWLSIDRESGEIVFETTRRGAIAYLNDLHKGRDTGPVWRWFIDVFAVAAIAFCLTGLWLLQLYAPGRKVTWPLVGAGLAIPAALALAFIHA